LVPAGKAAEVFLTPEAIDTSMKNLGMNQTHRKFGDRHLLILGRMYNLKAG
jgi:hypothetical protein